MPIYDYQCQVCGEVFEVRATIKEKEAGLTLVCPECSSHDARQRLTVVQTLHRGERFTQPVCGPDAGPGCCN